MKKYFLFNPIKKLTISGYFPKINKNLDNAEISLHTYKVSDEENRNTKYPNVSLGGRRVIQFDSPIFSCNLTIGLLPGDSIAEKLTRK